MTMNSQRFALMQSERLKRQLRRLRLLGIVALLCVPMACNLGTSESNGPPTLVPRATATPQATLGISGNGAPQATVMPNDIGTPVSNNTELEVYNLISQVDENRMMAHVEALQGFHTRHVNSIMTSETRGIGAAREYIKEQFEIIRQNSPDGSFSTFPHTFDLTYEGRTTRQENIVAVLRGTQAGASTLVIGAHYDSIALDFKDSEGFAPGANDNGTGVAAVLEVARIMSTRQHRSTIIFVLFSAEEIGRVGSKAFVQYLRGNNIDLVGMINVDSIGNANDRNGNIRNEELRVFSVGPNDTSTSRHMARTSEFLSFTHGMNMKLIVEDTIDREGRYGDHFSFSEVDYPAIRFISALEEKSNGDPTDTIEFVEPDYLKRATQSLLMVMSALADGPLPPRSVSLRDRGDGLSSLVWEAVPGATSYVVALRLPGSLRYDRSIEVTGTQIDWDGFRNYAGVAIAAKGQSGIVGRLSNEYVIR